MADTRSLSTPFLSFEPVNFSLTDGTNIPPPPAYQASLASQDKIITNTPPHTSSSQTAGFGGPLSSHPVTPVDSQQGFESFFNREMEKKTYGVNGSQPTSPNGLTIVSSNCSDANNFDPSLSSDQPSKDSSRKPNLFYRIMRLRSTSSLRSKSSLGKYTESTASLNQSQSVQTTTRFQDLDGDRVMKRPASTAPDASAGGSSTFPRMVRKKSMDLLSTARRKSGMWGYSDIHESAVEEERLKEQAGEDFLNDNGKPAQGTKHAKSTTPPPAVEVKGLDGGSFMNADVFEGIGHE